MKTLEQVKIELEAIENGYQNAQSVLILSNGHVVTLRKYDNRGNFHYSSYTCGKNTRLKNFSSYTEFIKAVSNYINRQANGSN
jgi:hypothetical protein